MSLTEWHIYGSSRIGIYQTSLNMAYRYVHISGGTTVDSTSTNLAVYSYTLFDLQRGSKRYELTNHLGNVLLVVSDKKIQQCSSGVVTSYIADVVSANDYSAFGAPLASRSYTASKYRFGFNGQEKDDEISGTGNSMTAEFWQYDSRLGRRWNVDHVVKVYESPYITFSNNPILLVDPNGADTCFSDHDTRTNVLEQVAKNKEFASVFQKLVDDKKTIYKFSQWESSKEKTSEEGTKYTVNGEVSYVCKEDNKDVINIGYTTNVPHYMPDLFAMYEETYHALQFQQGRFGFKTIKDKSFALDLGDEADAKIWAAKSIPGTINFTEGKPYLKKTREQIIKKLSQETAYEVLGMEDLSAMDEVLKKYKDTDPNYVKAQGKLNKIKGLTFRYEE